MYSKNALTFLHCLPKIQTFYLKVAYQMIVYKLIDN